MATVKWNGIGNWTGNPTDWNTGTPPASTDIAEIQTGTDHLTTTTTVKSIIVDSVAQLAADAGASLTTTGIVRNAGTFAANAGTTVHVGTQFYNSGTLYVGNDTNLTASATLTAASLVNTSSGYIALQGNASSGTTNQATLHITGSNSSTISGTVRVLGDADLELTTGITAVGLGGFFQIDGTQARVSIGAASTSTALANLGENEGTVNLDGNCSLGAGGTVVTTSVDFNNNGTLWVDYYNGDGATSVTFGGALNNYNTAILGNSGLGGNAAPGTTTTVTATALNNSGSLSIFGNATAGTTNQMTVNITGASPTTVTGLIRVGGDALLEFASGGFTDIGSGSQLELDGSQARISIGSGTTNSALTGLASNAGTFLLRGNTSVGAGGASVTTTTGFTNNGNLWLDYYGNDGGSSFSIGGRLVNDATTVIGNGSLSGLTTVTATGLTNTGSLAIQGNVSGGTANQATLNITGAGPATATGSIRVSGDALLEFASGGFMGIGNGSQLELDGSQARISIGNGTTNSGLTGLASNAGTFLLRGNSNLGAGGPTVTTTKAFTNTGNLWVDYYGNDGGSNLSIGGRLTNNATTVIGNGSLSASTTVSATGLSNTGTVIVQGNTSSGTTEQATLNITGAAPMMVNGSIRVSGDAMLEFASGGITGISTGSQLELDGSQARISIGSGTTNSALTGLASNAGTFLLRGNANLGAGAPVVTTTTGFTNNGNLWVDYYGNDGGSSLSIGGTLTNHVATVIGNGALSASTTVTATGLSTTGSLILQGNTASGATSQATLNVTDVAPTMVNGLIRVSGDALLEFASGGITGISNGSQLELDGSEARISIGNGTTNSALTGLASNAGTFLLRGNTNLGAGAPTVTTSTGFVNNGNLWIDYYGNDGGTSLNIGGRLTNYAATVIGNGALSASTTVTATSLGNTGSLTLQGNTASGATSQATLNIGAASPSAITGAVRISGDAMLEFASGGIMTINAGSSLELDGAEARISIGGGTTNSALSGLTTNNGTMLLRGNTNLGAGGVVVTTTSNFTNNATLNIDVYGNDGGSNLTVGGTLFNTGTMTVGNGALSTATTVNAAGLNNSGTLALIGDSSNLAEFVSNGAAINSGNLTIGANTELAVTAGHIFQQNAGTTTVSGLLAAGQVAVNGGVVDFKSALTSGNGTGALHIGDSGTLEFENSVDSSHTVTFTAATGTLELTTPGSFAGTIAGFSGDDAIDLVSAQVTGLSYSGNSTSGVLTVSGSGGTIATLAFKGNYTTASFQAVSDGNGGTDIIDPPSGGPSLALLTHYMSSMGGSSNGVGVTGVSDQGSAPQLTLAAAHA